MKRILALILALVLIFPLSSAVFATQQETAEEPETVAKSIALSGVTLPDAGKKIPSDPGAGAKVKILVSQSGKNELQEITGIPVTAAWSEKDTPSVPLTNGTFVAGRTYRLTVTLEFFDNAPKVKDGYTEFTVNNEKAAHLSNKGQEILFYCDFAATPGDFTPKVSLETKDNKTKEYDGKEITLTAKVEKKEGIDYSYAWYKDNKALKDQSSEEIKIKNVSQSGEYSCKVTAFLGSPDSGSFKTTQSAAVKIEITPHTVILEIDDVKKELFAKDPEFTYTLKGDIFDELEGNLEREEGEETGTYEITLGTLRFSDAVKDNYDLQIETGKLTIESTEKLPFVPLKSFGDQSYIVGKDKSKIKIFITKGSLPQGAMLTLSLPQTDAKENLESDGEKKILKSFSVTLLDEDGKTISLPKHASLQIMIPLTEKEEKAFDPKTITAALYDKGITSLSADVTKDGGVQYICVVTENLGTVALFEGKSTLPPASTSHKEEKEKSGGALLWVLVAIASILSVGAIFFTLWQIRKTDQKPKSAEKKISAIPTAEEQKEKERRRRIAEKLNSLPPIPEKTKPSPIENAEEKTQTRSFSAVAESKAEKTINLDPVEKAEKTIALDPIEKAEKTINLDPVEKAEKTINLDPIPENNSEKTIEIPEDMPGPISFEDLED